MAQYESLELKENKNKTCKNLIYISLISTFRDRPHIVQTPSILMPFVDNFTCFLVNGMIQSMLEPHLRQLGANVDQIGTVFLVQGCTYMVSAIVSGLVSS